MATLLPLTPPHPSSAKGGRQVARPTSTASPQERIEEEVVVDDKAICRRRGECHWAVPPVRPQSEPDERRAPSRGVP